MITTELHIFKGDYLVCTKETYASETKTPTKEKQENHPNDRNPMLRHWLNMMLCR